MISPAQGGREARRMPTWSLLVALATTLTASGLSADSANLPVGPRIIIEPDKPVQSYMIGDDSTTTVLICKTEGDKPGMFGQLKWSGPNKFDNSDELAKRHIVREAPQNFNTWELEFVKPTTEDSGTYHCRGTYQSSDVYNASVQVRFVNPLRFEVCPLRQFIVKGATNATIDCRVTGDTPSVLLKRNKEYLSLKDSRYIWNNAGLNINGEVNESDEAEYEILATAAGYRKSQKISVQVHSKPEFPDVESEFVGIEGEKAELNCSASGNPRPLYTWLDPGRKNLTSLGGYHVNSVTGSLIIDRVNRRDDNGEFQCSAYNTVGMVSRKIQMSVFTRPMVTVFENQTQSENNDITLECRASGHPEPSISIRRHGLNQQPYRVGDGLVKDVIKTVEQAGDLSVYIYRVTITATRSQFGLHYCNATNGAGTAEKTASLLVRYKPDLSGTSSEQYVKLGKQMSIMCHVRAFPPPTITWYSDTVQIMDPIVNIKQSSDLQTHTINMSPPMEHQSTFNKFRCKAQNTEGITEQIIVPRYTTKPGVVVANLLERTPTTVKLLLSVPNDGGDRIKLFRYRAEGRTLDINNPIYSFREDQQNETTIDASLNYQDSYIIRNLLPYYRYRLVIRAVNDVGEGDVTEIPIETMKPTRPDPPIIIKPSVESYHSHHSTSGTPSEYQNGYLLKWSPPDLDNGDKVTKYIIRYNKIGLDSLEIPMDDGEERIVEQMNERPLHARLGPMEVGQKYKIQLRARNKYGDSDPAEIVIYTPSDRPVMEELKSETLASLMDLSTPILYSLLVAAIILLVVIDLTFCLCFGIGVSHTLKNWCCRTKTTSVISDTTYER